MAGQSPLTGLAAVPPAPPAERPAALRQAILQAIAAARAREKPARRLAYKALERAYLEKTTSNEAAAEDLTVSRATFYRWLKRGVRGVAGALTLPYKE